MNATGDQRTGADAKRKRPSKRTLRLWSVVAGAAAFVLPWAVIRAAPTPVASTPAPQVIYLPAGARIVFQTGTPRKGGKAQVTTTSPSVAPAPAVTGGSKPPP
jgi:hypothetical protein